MKLFSRFFSLIGLFLFASAAQAATLTITDNLATSSNGSVAQHDPITHWQSFSTTLSASVTNPPQATSETTITGPTYQWSGGTSQIPLTSTQGQNSGLQSVSPPTSALPAGQNSITVNCTATFTRNNSAGNPIEQIPVSGNITVKFWSRVPAKIKEIARNFSPFYGPDRWGQSTNFNLQLQDNQPTAQPYGYADVKESFLPPFTVTDQPNGANGPVTWYVLPAGSNDPNERYIVDGNFIDKVGGISPTDHRLAPYNWTNDQITAGFTQGWTAFEAKPPYPSPYDQSTPLPAHQIVRHYMTETERSGG